MQDPTFFPHRGGLTIGEIASLVEGELIGTVDRATLISGLAPLDAAGSSDAAFFDNQRYVDVVRASQAGLVLVGPKHQKYLREDQPALLVRNASPAFAVLGRALFPSALTPQALGHDTGISGRAEVSPAAHLEEGVIVEAFAVIGAGAEIGRGTVIAPGAVIGPGCKIGRDCRIGPQATVTHSFLGNRVILHPGVRLGQDGFGYAPGAGGITKVVQVGRVIIQDDVEIGANTTVDRGAIRDTVIGEGTKIDNQVQVAHNVRIGRFCLIASQVGVAGSVTIGDGVMVGGQAGFNSHITVGDRAEIGATSSLASDMPAGARWGGTPAKPIKQWLRELTTLSDIARERRSRS